MAADPRLVAQVIASSVLLAFGKVVSSPAQCRRADAETANMIKYMTVLVTAPPFDVEHISKRQRYGIPVVNPNKIVVVTNAHTCSRALISYEQAIPSITPAPTSAYVVAVGTVYVVWIPGPTSPASEFQAHIVMNSKFAVLWKFAA